jgi:hypothetical protein
MGPVIFRPRPPGERPGQNSPLARWKKSRTVRASCGLLDSPLDHGGAVHVRPSAAVGPISRPASALGRLGGLILGEVLVAPTAWRSPAAAWSRCTILIAAFLDTSGISLDGSARRGSGPRRDIHVACRGPQGDIAAPTKTGWSRPPVKALSRIPSSNWFSKRLAA